MRAENYTKNGKLRQHILLFLFVGVLAYFTCHSFRTACSHVARMGQ